MWPIDNVVFLTACVCGRGEFLLQPIAFEVINPSSKKLSNCLDAGTGAVNARTPLGTSSDWPQKRESDRFLRYGNGFDFFPSVNSFFHTGQRK